MRKAFFLSDQHTVVDILAELSYCRSVRWLILASYYFLLELATRCEYKAVLTFTTCFEYLQRVGNI